MSTSLNAITLRDACRAGLNHEDRVTVKTGAGLSIGFVGFMDTEGLWLSSDTQLRSIPSCRLFKWSAITEVRVLMSSLEVGYE